VLSAYAKDLSAITFNLNYDPDATFTAAGLSVTDIIDMKAATSYAASQFTNNFNDPIHVNVRITAVSGTGTLGSSNTSLLSTSYTSIRNKALADSSTADDATSLGAGGSYPVADPVSGSHAFWVSRAEAKALAIIGDDAVTSDGTFTFGGGFSYTYDPNNRAVSGKIDFVGVAMHEVSEIMGRIGLLGTDLGSNGVPDYMLMDLFHYTGAGTRGINGGAGRSFSIDNGTTLLKAFNNVSGGDTQDWASGTNDAFNAFSSSGVLNALSAVDLRVLDVIGYNFAPVPEPSSIVLCVLGAVGCIVAAKRRK
jgi:hypothetical protein